MPKGLTPIRSNHRNDQLHTCCISYLLVTQRDPSFPFRIDYEFKGRFLPEGTSTPITAKLTLVTDFTFHRLPLSLSFNVINDRHSRLITASSTSPRSLACTKRGEKVIFLSIHRFHRCGGGVGWGVLGHTGCVTRA